MLTKRGVTSTVLEADDVVGGISRTAVRDGWRFDIGGHRFFTKVKPGRGALVRDPRPRRVPPPPPQEPHLLRGQVLSTTRSAPMNALRESRVPRGAALRRLLRVGADPPAEGPDEPRGLHGRPGSAGGSTASSSRPTPRSFGVSPSPTIQADWGAQRIKDLSLFRAVWEALKPKWIRRSRDEVPAGHEPHRGVQLPEVRAGDDVGAGRGARHRPRARRSCSTRRSPPCTTRTGEPSR